MTGHPLDGPRLKVGRASEHLNSLNRELEIFFQPYADRRILYHTFDGTRYRIMVRPPMDQPPPLRPSIICGDIAHNFRSALDHIIWQLVLAEGNEPDMFNQFPIYSEREKFDKAVRSPRRPDRSPLHGIDPDGRAWATIEEAQPYCRDDPRADPLTMLATLSNADKHRTLLFQMLFTNEDSLWNAIGWNRKARLLDYRVTTRPLSLEHDTEIAWLRFSNKGPGPQVRVKGDLTMDPTFGNGTFQVPVVNLNDFRPHFSSFVEDFKPFFL